MMGKCFGNLDKSPLEKIVKQPELLVVVQFEISLAPARGSATSYSSEVWVKKWHGAKPEYDGCYPNTEGTG
jgi:hypothetical protein